MMLRQLGSTFPIEQSLICNPNFPSNIALVFLGWKESNSHLQLLAEPRKSIAPQNQGEGISGFLVTNYTNETVILVFGGTEVCLLEIGSTYHGDIFKTVFHCYINNM